MEHILFLGLTEENLPENRLTTSIEVLKAYFHQTRVLKKTKCEAANIVANKLIHVWNNTKLVDEYGKLIKNYGRITETQITKQNIFLEKIYELFDITNNTQLRENLESDEIENQNDNDNDYEPSFGKNICIYVINNF